MGTITHPVLAPILPRALGDFVEHSIGAVLATSTLDLGTYANSTIVALYVADMPWKKVWLSHLTDIKITVDMEKPVPFEWLDTAARPRVDIPQDWLALGLADPAHILTPRSMNRVSVNRHLTKGRKVGIKRLPPIVPGTYAAVHWNAHGYEGRPNDPDRALTDDYVEPLLVFLENELGMPYVVVGHKSVPRRSFEEEINVIANARYMVELSPSGPAAITMAYGVPWLRLNTILKQRSGNDAIVRAHTQHSSIDDWSDRQDVCLAGGHFTKMPQEEAELAIREFHKEFG